MLRALELAKQGLYTTAPNPCVGSVVVNRGEIVGQGWHHKAGQAHAEVLALQAAGEQTKGATLYVTMEPCAHHGRTPPCCDAIIAAGIERVVCADLDPSKKNHGKGLAKLSEHHIETEVGLHSDEAMMLNPGFFSLSLKSRPWIRIKLAISLDGRTALPSGESQWISSKLSRQDVQFQRARADALLTTSGTVVQDNPHLNVRLSANELGVETVRQPLRIVIDTKLRTSAQANIYQPANQVLLVTSDEHTQGLTEFEDGGIEIWQFPLQQGKISPLVLYQRLAEREIGEIQVEAGEQFIGTLIKEGLYDELLLYVAPILLGEGKALAMLPALDTITEQYQLTWQEVSRLGENLRLVLRPQDTR